MITPIAEWLTLDDTGLQMPWYTRPCLEWLDTLDIKGKLIFEYGMGNSTKWYASRGAEVFGVDSNPEWGAFANQFGHVLVTDNQQDYLYEIYKGYNLNTDSGTIDLVIIDGLYRDDCTEHALKCLKPGGILIIDNWEQPSVEPNDWTKTKELIKDLKQTVYKEPEHPDWRTLVVEL
jgi:predicted O-methyltransferase YrrM